MIGALRTVPSTWAGVAGHAGTARRRRRGPRPGRPPAPARARTHDEVVEQRRGRPGSPGRSRRGRRAGAPARRCSVAITSTSSTGTPSAHRDPAHLVDVAVAQQHVRLAVVGAEGAELRAVLAHQRQQRAQVARVGGLAQQHPHARAGASPAPPRPSSPRGRSGSRPPRRRPARGPTTPGACPSACEAPRTSSFSSTVRIAGDDAGEVHHLGDAERPPAAQDRLHVADRQLAPRRLERARGHARRRHHEHGQRQPLGGVEHPVHAVGAEHVGDLVRVADDRGRPVREHGARELRRA